MGSLIAWITKKAFEKTLFTLVVLVAGLEPARPCERGILSPLRLPFRHTSILEVPPGFEPGNEGFADPCLTAWLWYHF